MTDVWERLELRLSELADLDSALRLMGWDQHVMMPPGGGPGRGRATGTLQGLAHSRLIDTGFGDLLQEAEADESLSADQAAAVRLARRAYDKATKLPETLVKEMAELESVAFQAWAEARPANDFSILQPHLEKMVRLKKDAADAIGWSGERYDALLDDFEPEITTAEVEELFDDLVPALKPVADKILSAAGERPAFLSRTYEADKQEDFCRWLVGQLGFDLSKGRFDVSPHPFTAHVGRADVRQTTRYEENRLLASIRASIHETGHALFEQGIPDELWGLPTGNIESLGLHESQSRIWEIQVGTSREFLDFMLPHLKERFPQELGNLSPDEFYRGVNHPRRSMIRVESDAVTYNLHIALRFELELALFRDQISVGDLPDAFDAGMEKYVGIRPDTRTDGVLQDMHWSVGAFGYFPTYTLGTMYAAALFDRARQGLPNLADELRAGDTSQLLSWLRDKVHHVANRKPGKAVAEEAIGGRLTAAPFLTYLKTKYAELYDLEF